MYICSCFAVTDGQIRTAVTDGVKTWKQLTKQLKVSTNCGTCGIEAKAIFDKAIADRKQAISQCETRAECCGGGCDQGKGKAGK